MGNATTLTAGLVTRPDPTKDRAGKPVPEHIAAVLSVLSILIEYGRHLTATVEHRAIDAASPPSRSCSAPPPCPSFLLTSTAVSCGSSRWSKCQMSSADICPASTSRMICFRRAVLSPRHAITQMQWRGPWQGRGRPQRPRPTRQAARTRLSTAPLPRTSASS